MKNKQHYLSVIVPVFQQEKTIVKDLNRIKNVTGNLRYPHEIIVVVDGITDTSLNKIKQAKIPRVITLGYMKNQGKSHAIRLGMKKAKGDYVMFIDSGMEIDPNGISMLIEHMEWYEADIIVGSKRHPASFVDYSLIRKILSLGYYYFVKLLFGLRIQDTQAGIKIFKKKVLEAILPKLLEKKFAGDLEMLVVAKSLGFIRIYEAPIKLNYHFGSITSAATLNSIFRIFIDTLAIFYRKNILRYYDKPQKK